MRSVAFNPTGFLGLGFLLTYFMKTEREIYVEMGPGKGGGY